MKVALYPLLPHRTGASQEGKGQIEEVGLMINQERVTLSLSKDMD